MKERVEVSAPGKLMLFGEHAVVYGRPCIVTAVDQRMMVLAERTSEEVMEVNAPEVGVKNLVMTLNDLKKGNFPSEIRFLGTAVKNFFKNYHLAFGLKIKTRSDFLAEFGFGSSSAVTVGVLKALSELFEVKMTNKELFDLSYKTVLEVQSVGSGFDLAAAIWGGTLYFVTGGKKLVRLEAKDLPLVVGYTGVKADTPTLVKKVKNLYQAHPKSVEAIFGAIATIVKEARQALIGGEFKRLGMLMNINQGLLEALGVSTEKLSSLILAARRAGAYGAKLSGAGGGDCMIAFAPKEARLEVEKAIQKAGGKVIKVQPNALGLKVEEEEK